MQKYSGEPATELHIPTPVIEMIYDILAAALVAEVPYSDDPLEMAQSAVRRLKVGIAQTLNLLLENCPIRHKQTFLSDVKESKDA